MKRIGLIAAVGAAAWAAAALAASTSAPGAKVFIAEPKDGAEVSAPVMVKFGVEGMEVVPAGTDKPNSGHFHLLVDGATLPSMDAPIPKDDTHIHYGKGQMDASLPLKPGKHTLQLVLGDKDHVPHQPALMSDTITITVK